MSDAVEHARNMLEALGLDDAVDPELATTPERFTGLLQTIFAGLDADPPALSTFPADTTGSAADTAEPVVLAGLKFQSMCVHHLVPMFGTIDVAYVPGEHIVGFGSVGRAIDYVAARPQVQERIVAQLCDLLADRLQPAGLLVRCRARQLCMELRGAQKAGVLVSSASRGTLTNGPRRRELLDQFIAAESTL